MVRLYGAEEICQLTTREWSVSRRTGRERDPHPILSLSLSLLSLREIAPSHDVTGQICRVEGGEVAI